MKKLMAVLVLALMFSSSAVFAGGMGSAFGTLTTARSSGMGTGSVTVGVGVADATSVGASFNYGLSNHTDGRIRLAMVDTDGSDTKIALEADFRYQIISVDGISNGPFDMSLGGFAEYMDQDPWSIFQLGGQFIGSYPVKLKNGRTLTPYGRFNIRLEKIKLSGVGFQDYDESNIEFGLNGGVMWELTNTINLFGEFQIDGNDGVFLGIEFDVL